MGDILFLAHRIPFPPDRGDKIRSHHLLRYLAERARVHVGCFADGDADLAERDELAALAATYWCERRCKPLALAGIEALASHRPVSETAFDDRRLHDWVARTIARERIDTIFVFSGQMGQYVPDDFAGRVIVDLCDVDSAKFEAYGREGSGPRAFIDSREARMLAKVEERLAPRADATLLISDEEAALFRSRLRDTSCIDLHTIRNGIAADVFDPTKVRPHPDLAETSGPHFVFTGQMDYAPNVAAVERWAREIMPAIRTAHPQAAFNIVGRAPTAAVKALGGEHGTRVWGAVPDVRPFLAGADIVVAPLTIARGVQNKVLEAMAMARPVLLSPEAATGIDARDGEHFAVEATDEGLVNRALALLADPLQADHLGRAARTYVLAQQSWPAMLAPLGGLLGIEAEDARNAA